MDVSSYYIMCMYLLIQWGGSLVYMAQAWAQDIGLGAATAGAPPSYAPLFSVKSCTERRNSSKLDVELS